MSLVASVLILATAAQAAGLKIDHQPVACMIKDRFPVIEAAIEPILRREGFRPLVNPAGRFVIGGPSADVGFTGRKTQVDSYGGYARHGGGCFSGKVMSTFT